MKKESLQTTTVKTLLAVLLFAGMGIIILGGGCIIWEYNKNKIDNKIIEPINQETENCAKEGETIHLTPSSNSKAKNFCCEGLNEREPYIITNDNKCDIPLIYSAICINCPNGKCGIGENKCNCPEDCGEKIDTSNWQTYWSEKYGFEIKYPKDWARLQSSPAGNTLIELTKDNDYCFDIWVAPTFTGVGHNSTKISETNIKIEGLNTARKLYKTSDGEKYYRINFKHNNNVVHYVIKYPEVKENIFEQILSTFKFVEQDGIVNWQTYQNKGYGFEFQYPKEWGDCNKLEEAESFEKDRGKTYGFSNSDFKLSFEKKGFEVGNQFYAFTLDRLPAHFGKIADINNYCSIIEKENNFIGLNLSCEVIDLDNQQGILRDDLVCVGSRTGGDIGCVFKRILLINNKDLEYPLFIINTSLGRYNYYESCDSFSFDKCFDGAEEKYKEALEKYENKIGDFNQIISSFKFIEN